MAANHVRGELDRDGILARIDENETAGCVVFGKDADRTLVNVPDVDWRFLLRTGGALDSAWILSNSRAGTKLEMSRSHRCLMTEYYMAFLFSMKAT